MKPDERSDAKPSVIQQAPPDNERFLEQAIVAVLHLLQADCAGSIFVQKDRGQQWRITVERVEEAKA